MPISRHPLFPVMTGLWFAALFSLGGLAAGSVPLERVVMALRIDQFISAAAPPLGLTARLLFASALFVAGGLAGLILGLVIARRERPKVVRPGFAPGESLAPYSDEALVRPMESAADESLRGHHPVLYVEDDSHDDVMESAPKPDITPQILDVAALGPSPHVAEAPDVILALAGPVTHRAPATEAPIEDVSVVDACDVQADIPLVAQTTAPAGRAARIGLLPHSAAEKLRSAPLESLGVVELAERLALAISQRRESQAASLANEPEPAPLPGADEPSLPLDLPGPGPRIARVENSGTLLAMHAPLRMTLARSRDATETTETADSRPEEERRFDMPVPSPLPEAPEGPADPAATERALKAALATLQRMSGAA